MRRRLNIERLFSELGGAAATAEIVGVSRAQPYRWMKNKALKVRDLDAILTAFPSLSLDDFVEENDEPGANA